MNKTFYTIHVPDKKKKKSCDRNVSYVSLPKQPNIYVSTLNELAEDKVNVADDFCQCKGGKHCEKKRKYPVFCLYPTIFSKAFFFRVAKVRIV